MQRDNKETDMNTIKTTTDSGVCVADINYGAHYARESKPLSKFGEWFFSNKGDFNLQINDMKAILK